MLAQAETSTSVRFRKRKKPNTPDGGEAGQHRASRRGGVRDGYRGTGSHPGKRQGRGFAGRARVRAAQPGLAGDTRVRVPVGTAAWDEPASACARAEIRTRGPGEQLQPDPSQRCGNQVSARNLPAAPRSTRSRHLPQLPARRRPRLFEGGVSGRPSSAWAGPSQDKVSSKASLLLVGGTLAAPWLPVGGALESSLSRGRGCRGPWLLLGGTGNPMPAPPRSPGWPSVGMLTRVVGCPTYHARVPLAQLTDLPAGNLQSRKSSQLIAL